jgi:PAS domain S-box-containing protein
MAMGWAAGSWREHPKHERMRKGSSKGRGARHAASRRKASRPEPGTPQKEKEILALLSAVIESSDDGIISKNLAGIITSWNRAAQRIFGYSAKEAVGKHISLLIPVERRGEEDEIIRRLRRGERIAHFETVRQTKDGRLIDVSITVSPIKDGDGRVIGASKIARDITERRHEERRRKFLSDAVTGFGQSLDLDTTSRSIVTSAIPVLADFAVLDLLTPENQIRRVAWAHGAKQGPEFDEIGRFVPPRYSPTHPVSRAIETGMSTFVPQVDKAWIEAMAVSDHQARFLKRQGLRSLLTVLLTARGRVLGTLTLFLAESGRRHSREDIALSEEYARRASEALENALLYRDAQSAIGDREKFLSIASHELKTPLTSLQLQLQVALRMLKKGGPDALKTAVAQLTIAERQGFRIGKLVNDLLDISRITAGKLDLEIDDCDLSELIRSVATHFSAELADKGVTVEIRSPEPVWGRWDRFRLDQVVTNLLSNAIKYGDGKPIAITVEAVNKSDVKIIVRDQGIGMEPDFLNKIFTPFEQGEPSAQRGGLGLGLYISRQIIEAHGGRITVTSMPGEGSTFIVQLPRVAKE